MPKEYIVLTKEELTELITILDKAEAIMEEMRQLSLDIRMQKFRLLSKKNDK